MILLYFVPRTIREKLKKDYYSLVQFFSILITFFIICIAFMFFFKFTENVSWMEAFWQTWQTATTVGYGNKPAETYYGRLTTILFGTIAIAYLPVFIGIVFDYITGIREKRRLGFMQNQKKNGYVLFNLPETSKLKTFILEIRSKENDVPFCIVDAQIETLPKEIELLGDIEFVKGPLLDRDTYQRAQIKQCTTIVVFPIRSGDSTSDSMTQTIVQLCLQFIDLQKTRIIHTLVDAGHEWLFADLKSTQVIENMSLLATVQECQDKYSAEILEQIISNTCGANPNTFEFKKIKNITWGEFNETANKVAIEENIKINILALIQNEKADACPQPQTKITIGDHISILAFHDFSWVRFEEKVLNNI